MNSQRWIAFTEGFWNEKSDKLIDATVKLVNRQSFSTNDDRYNMMHQINFGYKFMTTNVGIWGYNTDKFGGYSTDDDWQDVKDFFDNDVRVTYGENIGISEFMSNNGLINRTEEEGAWLTLDIPFVSEAGKQSQPFIASSMCLATDYNDTLLTAIVVDILGKEDTADNKAIIDTQMNKTEYCYNSDISFPVYIWGRKFNDIDVHISDKRIRNARTRINNNRIKVGAFRQSRKDNILEHFNITKISVPIDSYI